MCNVLCPVLVCYVLSFPGHGATVAQLAPGGLELAARLGTPLGAGWKTVSLRSIVLASLAGSQLLAKESSVAASCW